MESKRTRLKRATTKQKYPFFHDIADATTDPEWQEVFREMALGRFPVAGLGVNGQHLAYKPTARKKVEFEVLIPSDPAEAATVLMDVLYQRLGINRHDVGTSLLDYLCTAAKPRAVEWNKLKTVEQLLTVPDFVQRYRDEHQLTADQARQLQLTVEQAIEEKHLRKDDVVFENNHLLAIKTLHECDGQFRIDYTPRTTAPASRVTTLARGLRSLTHSSTPLYSRLQEVFRYYYGQFAAGAMATRAT